MHVWLECQVERLVLLIVFVFHLPFFLCFSFRFSFLFWCIGNVDRERQVILFVFSLRAVRWKALHSQLKCQVHMGKLQNCSDSLRLTWQLLCLSVPTATITKQILKQIPSQGERFVASESIAFGIKVFWPSLLRRPEPVQSWKSNAPAISSYILLLLFGCHTSHWRNMRRMDEWARSRVNTKTLPCMIRERERKAQNIFHIYVPVET